MKLQRTTLILMLVALGLGGFVYFYEIQGGKQREEQQANKQKLFQFAVDDIQKLTITKPDSKILLERNRQDNPRWLLKSPINEPANNASVSYLTDLLTTATKEKLNLDPQTSPPLSEYGLDSPTATIEIELKNQNRHQIILGKPSFNNTQIYAQTDNKPEVFLLSQDFFNAVNRQLDEWKQAPEPFPSPTFSPPSPSPTN
ncbi:DUF4340 domain-containing protein [Calothrix sp. NIES-3974]|uniref:DUF4340 domain-containing protein n=1 Tax=Calothrix sp. NIES-3974 TaxID=2005462 RepID=UPI000B5EEB07|nr:DUF4340 domain-containing protein [Calothrix sp. NIES-3974]BAZ04809.1 hypothetical protein NIES3974_14520 [Calothrix sp. NIES-3974]